MIESIEWKFLKITKAISKQTKEISKGYDVNDAYILFVSLGEVSFQDEGEHGSP